MKVNGIVAVSENGVIGANNALPWSLPNDLKNFRKITGDHPVVMGRKTFESIGRPLPRRLNIVISHKRINRAPGCIGVSSPETALGVAFYKKAREVFVIGGAQIYREMEPFITRWYVTVVHTETKGDAYFTHEFEGFDLVSDKRHPADERHEHSYSFKVYNRR
jgi:dihydrofolate reductase